MSIDIEVQGRFIAVLPVEFSGEGGVKVQLGELGQTFEVVGIGSDVDLSKHPTLKVGSRVWCADFFRYDFAKIKTKKDYQFTTIDKIFAIEVEIAEGGDAVN